MHSDIAMIAVTGGPCGGKTTFLARARQYLEDHGFYVATLPEIATHVMEGIGISPQDDDWKNPRHFQELVLRMTLSQEELVLQALSRLSTTRKKVILADRGALDGMAYIGRDAFGVLLKECELSVERLMQRYVGVLYLVSAADGAEEFYSSENNPSRYEATVKEALERELATRDVWYGHSHLKIIDNRTGFEEKMVRAIAALARILSIPEPVEREKRFWVHAYLGVPKEAVAVRIVQDYLELQGHGVRRVRRREVEGVSSYYYTEKRHGAYIGESIELERQITHREYELLVRERKEGTETIEKVRYCFAHGGHYLELDVIQKPEKYAGRVYLEAEVVELDEIVKVPDGWNVTEVTHLSGHGNYSMARGVAVT